MGFWQRIRDLLTGSASGAGAASGGDPYGIYLYYRCQRCGTPVRVRVDRRNDLNREDDGPGAFVLRKEVMDNRCFGLIHSEVWFDSAFAVVASDVTGGQVISEAEYEALAAPEPPQEEPDTP